MDNLDAEFERMSMGGDHPIDVDTYFRQHADRLGDKFRYNPAVDVDIKETFDRLAKAAGWRRKGKRNTAKLRSERERFFRAIAVEFIRRFGDIYDIRTWHRLLLLLGYRKQDLSQFRSQTKCKKVGDIIQSQREWHFGPQRNEI